MTCLPGHPLVKFKVSVPWTVVAVPVPMSVPVYTKPSRLPLPETENAPLVWTVPV